MANAFDGLLTGQQSTNRYTGPAPKAAPSVPQKAPTPPVGPTGFWGRITTIGVGKVNALNAYRTTVQHKPAVQSNSFEQNKKLATTVKSTTPKVVKEVGKALVSSENAVARGTSRVLPGGNKDIDENLRMSNESSKRVDQISRDMKSGKLTREQAQKMLKGENKNTDSAVKTQKGIEKTMPTRTEIAAGGVGTALDIVTLGGAKLAKEGVKYGVEKGAQKVATGSVAKKGAVEALKYGGKKTEAATIAGTSAAAGAANAKASGAKGKDVALQAGAGAAIPLAGQLIPKAAGAIRSVFKEGPKAALERARGKTPVKTGEMKDVMTPAQADKAAAAAHTKINVNDTTPGAEAVGVKTPVRPGIKESSSTYKVGVRTPQKMSDQEYTTRFNKLSKSYDQEYAKLADKPPATQKMLGKAIDNRHAKALDTLDTDYQKGILAPKTTVTKLTSQISKAEKTTGGAPKAGVNVQNAEGKIVPAKAPKVARDTNVPTKEEPKTTSGLTGVKETPKTVKELRQTTPGEQRVSGSALKTEQKAVESHLTKEFENKNTYTTVSHKADAEDAVKLVNDNPDEARAIAMGSKAPRTDSYGVAVRHAVERKARDSGDVDTLRAIASSRVHSKTSEAAQTLGAEAYHADDHSPVTAMQHVVAARTQALEKRSGSVSKAVKETSKEIESSIKPPSKFDWQSFVENIKC